MRNTSRVEPDAAEYPADGGAEERSRFLLQYAVLAPSSHNSQPWAFAVEGGEVHVYADESRRLDVADPSVIRALAALQTRADEQQFADPDYRAELGHWIGTGTLGANWLTARIGQLAVQHLDLGDREGQKDSALLTSAPVVGIITAETDAVGTWLRVGQVVERIALLATTEGIAVHPMSQILEVPELRAELADCLGIDDATPQHLFRAGFAEPDSTRTPRQPLAEVVD